MSYHKLTTNSLNTSVKVLLKRGVHLGLGLGAFTPILALANPTGGQVMAGAATITNPNANHTVVKQASQSAIIDWQQFNIGQGQFVQFLQPSSSSVILNRVIGGGGSTILGSLTGNGQVFLINTNGVVFGRSANIDTQGFLASTLDIADSDFMSGNFNFQKSGSDAGIVNQGRITAHNGGYVVLAGDYANNAGIISAQSGHVVLASGAKSILTLNGNGLVNYAVDQATLSALAGVSNSGRVVADGGTVVMTADVANLLKATVVNNTGLIEAHSMSKSASGVISLTATGGNIVNAGTLDVSGTRMGTKGGDITLKTDEETILTGKSRIFATGIGANGGNLEVSGDSVRVRGVANLGNHGNLLLDPGTMTITSGSMVSNNGPSGGSSAIVGNGTIGVKYIQNQLNNNTAVHITAGDNINASSHVTKITATGIGSLDLLVGHGGQIDLAGVAINIGGDLKANVYNAVASHSHNANMNFGRITANSVEINAGAGGNVHLAPATGTGTTLKPSVKTTSGNIQITAGHIDASPSGSTGGSLNLQAKADVFLSGAVNNVGNVSMKASGEGISASNIKSGKNVTLQGTAFFAHNDAFNISAASNITLKGEMGSAGAAMVGSVDLTAGKTISLDHGIFNTTPIILFEENITITGKSLVYTGAHAFVLSAQNGNINLDASIGSAGNHAGYSVKLVDNGYGINFERSIFTNGGIAASQSGSRFGSEGFGVRVGNSDGKTITLSANGPITIVGNKVRIGDEGKITISADDGKSSTHTDKLTLTGLLSGSSWGVVVGGAGANVNVASGSTSVDHSVTLHAGQDVDINAQYVTLEGGTAFAEANGSAKSVTVNTSLTVSAGNDINLTGANVRVDGGYGFASVTGDSKSAVSAKVDTSVTLNAGHDVNVSGSYANFIGGGGDVFTVTDAAKQKAKSTVVSGVNVSAGNDISVTETNTITVHGGDYAAYDGYAFASDSSAQAASAFDTDVTLNAGHAIALAGTTVQMRGGMHAAGGSSHTNNFGSGVSVSYSLAHVQAGAKSATASLTVSTDVSLKAGAGGITIGAGAGDISISGGYGAARGLGVSAGGVSGNKATGKVSANVSLTTSGDMTILGEQVYVRGGKAAGYGASSFIYASCCGIVSSDLHRAHAVANGGTATLAADASVTLSAGGNLAVTASDSEVSVAGGKEAGANIDVYAGGSSAQAAATINASVSLSAGKGIQLTGNSVALAAGSDAAGGTSHVNPFPGGFVFSNREASVEADAKSASAALTDSADVNLTAGGGGINVTATTSSLNISAGYGVARGLEVSTGSQANTKASAAISAHVTLSTSGNMKLKATNINVRGADEAAGSNFSFVYLSGSGTVSHGTRGAAATTSKGAAALSADGSVTLHAGGALSMTASTGHLSINGGSSAGHLASATASSGGNASIKTDASVSITVGGNATLKAATGIQIYAYSDLVQDASAHADDGGTATISGKDGVTLTAGGALLASAGTDLEIYGASDNGYGANAGANHGATANVSGDGSVNIKAGSIALTAVDQLSIHGGKYNVGASASADASNAATASVTAKSGVSLITSGALIAKAGGSLEIFGGESGDASYADVSAYNHAQAKLTTDTSVNVSADSVTLSASADLLVHGPTGNLLTNGSGYGSNFGVATATANAGVNITAVKSFTATLTGSGASHSLEIAGASDVAYKADAIAHKHGTATLSGDGHTSITVTGAGGTVTLSTGNQTHAYLSIGGYDDNAYSAYAYADHGGSAAITALGGVNISAAGDISIKAKGPNTDISIYGGYDYNAYGASAYASGNAAKADVTADSSVHLSGHNVTISAGTDIEIYGGYEYNASGAFVQAKNGGTATVTADASVTITAAGNFTAKGSELSIYAGYEDNADGATVEGYGGVGTLNADTSVNITAGGAVKLVATGSSGWLGIYGQEDYQAYDGRAIASNGGAARLNANGSVNITAGTTFTASGAYDLSIYGGDYSNARGADASADGVGATATIKSVGSVNINAGGNVIIKSAKYAEIYGGYEDDAYDAEAYADNGGIASLSNDGSVNIATKGGFTLQASGFSIYGGYEYDAYGASASADHSGKATLSQDGSVNIKAAGAVSLTGTLKGAKIFGGYKDNAYSADAIADDGATANLSANGSVHITAGTTFTASVQGDLSIYGGYSYNAYNASANASHGGKANLSADASVSLGAGGALTLKAENGGTLSIYGGLEYDGAYAEAYASNGAIAGLTAKTSVNITAGGAFTGVGDGGVQVWGQSYYNGYEATIDAYNGGKAAMTADGSVSIKGSSLSLTANTGTLSIYGGYEENGYDNTVSASNAGAAASLTENTSVTLTATSGNVTIKASGEVDIHGDEYYAGYANTVEGEHGATASLTADGSVNISGAAVSLTASSDLYVYGGSEAGADNTVEASDGGAATLTGDASVNIKATSGFTATIKGSHSNAYFDIYGGEDAGYDNGVTADSGAKATLNGKSGVKIDAGAGDINLKITGTHAASNYIEVYGGEEAAYDLTVDASDGGVAVDNGNTAVNLLTGGNVLISNKTGKVTIYGNGYAADDATAEADGTGAKATVTGIGGVNIKAGGAVAVQAGTDASIHGGNDAAASADASGNSAGVASIKGVESVTITAGGAFTATAGEDLDIYGGGTAGYGANIEAYTGATGKLSGLGSVSIKAGLTVSLKAGTATNDTLGIHGGAIAGAGTTASFIASNAKATFTAKSGVSVNAGGAMTLTAGGPIEITAGNRAGSNVFVNGDHGAVTATVNSAISLVAGGGLTLALNTGNLSIAGGSEGGRNAEVSASGSAGVAKLGLTQTVSLAAAGAFTVTGANNINIVAGLFAATGTDAAINSAGGGAATANVNSGITIKGASISVHHTGLVTKTPRAGLTGALTENGALTITGGHITSFVTPAPLGMEVQMMPMSETPFELAPSTGQSGFAVPQGLSRGVDLSATPQLFPVTLTGGATAQTVPSTGPAVLATLLGDGIVVNLMPVTFGPDARPRVSSDGSTSSSIDFTPGLDLTGYQGDTCPVVSVNGATNRCQIR